MPDKHPVTRQNINVEYSFNKFIISVSRKLMFFIYINSYEKEGEFPKINFSQINVFQFSIL